LDSLSKACHLLWSVLHILQNDPSSSTRMYRVLNLLTVPCVQWQCWWGAFYVSLSSLLQYIAKIRKGIWKSFATLLVTFHVFAQLLHLVAVRQGLCCFYLNSCCKYVFI
jgi:hypothetical protein